MTAPVRRVRRPAPRGDAARGWGGPAPGLRAVRSGGFTLIEMVVVLAIVGILAAAAQPLLELGVRRTREFALREALRSLRGAIDAYRQAVDEHRIASPADASGYPPSLEALVQGVPALDAKGQGGKAAKMYFLRRLPRDPFADPALPAAQTWGLRAYDSAPDTPAAGRDVFDVYSRSEAVALDGTRYKDW